MMVSLIAIAFLLVMSAFFSCSETALTAASRPLMHQLEKKGSRRAAVVNRLREKKERMIGTLLLGNNLVNILASAMATSIAIALYGEAGVAYATIAMTLLVLIFGEVLPKVYAFSRANRVALGVAPLISGLALALTPATRAVNLLVRGVLKIMRIDIRDDYGMIGTEEELRGAIELHGGKGRSVEHKRDMLHSVLDLDNVQVGEIMVHRRNMAMINADQPVQAIVDQMLSSPFSRIPLWRGQPDNIVGVLHAKALLKALRERGEKRAPLDIVALAAKPWFIPESTTLLNQLHAFRRRRQHFALMVNEYGSLMGIVTLEDILEEIVGEIFDEHDIATIGIRPQPDGSYIVDGVVTIRDLNRQFSWNLPDEEAATIAGLIIHESRRIPESGQAFMFHDFRFEILTRIRHQITSVRITPPFPKADKRAAKEPPVPQKE